MQIFAIIGDVGILETIFCWKAYCSAVLNFRKFRCSRKKSDFWTSFGLCEFSDCAKSEKCHFLRFFWKFSESWKPFCIGKPTVLLSGVFENFDFLEKSGQQNNRFSNRKWLHPTPNLKIPQISQFPKF